jgi:pyruvate, water dikinase
MSRARTKARASSSEAREDGRYVRGFAALRRADIDFAGGKGANLGELTAAGLPVPPGFVVGAPAFAALCAADGLGERIASRLAALDVEDTRALEAAAEELRGEVEAAPLPEGIAEAILAAYAELGGKGSRPAVAVRSSATAEDTESASFAGMNETLLNVAGAEAVVEAVRRCWASLFGARTIYYRVRRGFEEAAMGIAVVVQVQVESARAGVMFTLDPASGERDRLVIEGAFGLGESVVSGSVSPDRYVVLKDGPEISRREVRRKELTIEAVAGGGTATRELEGAEAEQPVLADPEVLEIAGLGMRIEDHYGAPQDTEWAIDAAGTVWILQARPVTVSAPGTAAGELAEAPVLLRGLGAARGVAHGPVRVVRSLEAGAELREGEILVTHMTAPDWVPLMRRAAAIVTDSGGMTCHAAIVSRELGIPCLVGTGEATSVLEDGQVVSVDAGAGVVLAGAVSAADPSPAAAPEGGGRAAAPVTATKILVNLSEPSQLSRLAGLEIDGVGLLRAELMVVEALGGVHPRALLEAGEGERFVEGMAARLREFAVALDPRPITYRTIDFRSNEFRGLQGGERFEPQEANPMIGYRGAFRYAREPDLFELELQSLARVWEEGHRNLHVMLPFVRSARELEFCREVIDRSGLGGQPRFELWVMAEVPSVLLSLSRYAELGIAGISIGSNDLTQLLLGVDRDSEIVAEAFDELDPAVTTYVGWLIERARELGLATSICGQAPSVYPEYADLLVGAGIDAISVNLDAVDQTRRLVASAERRLMLRGAREEGEAQ